MSLVLFCQGIIKPENKLLQTIIRTDHVATKINDLVKLVRDTNHWHGDIISKQRFDSEVNKIRIVGNKSYYNNLKIKNEKKLSQRSTIHSDQLFIFCDTNISHITDCKDENSNFWRQFRLLSAMVKKSTANILKIFVQNRFWSPLRRGFRLMKPVVSLHILSLISLSLSLILNVQPHSAYLAFMFITPLRSHGHTYIVDLFFLSLIGR